MIPRGNLRLERYIALSADQLKYCKHVFSGALCNRGLSGMVRSFLDQLCELGLGTERVHLADLLCDLSIQLGSLEKCVSQEECAAVARRMLEVAKRANPASLLGT